MFGCAIDVAVDGASAVSKMEGKRGEEGGSGYDLVLMVCSTFSCSFLQKLNVHDY